MFPSNMADDEEEGRGNAEQDRGEVHGRGREGRRATVQIGYDTMDYKRDNANLPWCERIAARNCLSIVFALTASLPSVFLYGGAKAIVDAVSSNAAVRMGVWALVSAVVVQFSATVMMAALEPEQVRSKVVDWFVLVAVWSTSFVVMGGSLGLWAVAVTWVAWIVGALVHAVIKGDAVGAALLDGLIGALIGATSTILVGLLVM